MAELRNSTQLKIMGCAGTQFRRVPPYLDLWKEGVYSRTQAGLQTCWY